jgi:hypothetical protein
MTRLCSQSGVGRREICVWLAACAARVEEVTDYGSGRRPHRELPPITWDARQGVGWHAHIGRYEDGREFGAVLQILPLGG